MRSQSHKPDRILVVDDDQAIRRLLQRLITRLGFDCDIAENGEDAFALIRSEGFSTVISDITMPGMNGTDLLQRVRLHDSELPVILMTGSPSVDTAIVAVDHGAFRYVPKPFDPQDLSKTIVSAVNARRLAILRQESMEIRADSEHPADPEVEFEDVLPAIWMAHQPLIRARDGSVFGYEALLRSSHPTYDNPGALLDLAEERDRLDDLTRAIHQLEAGALEDRKRERFILFLNAHPRMLQSGECLDLMACLQPYAERIVIEVTERESLTNASAVRESVRQLRSAGFRIAVDDLGAGYAGLTTFALLEPDFVKLDMTLVRDIHEHPMRQKLVSSMVEICRQMEIQVVAEGVENPRELHYLLQSGCDLLQGYYFAKPGRGFPIPQNGV